ncbi:hypothetical protein [Rickettsia sp. TH2014]|uniref:hypothetical protein n=1 Tax=Rickettsia sp. TH2014 TaxID=1967503 RepID=UPI001C4446DB|nr:hypothetical protein [Rickettsia sp. TH2014]
MSKDGQDDKNVNNDKEKQKDTHDLQALNDIGSIIARMHSASSVATLQDIRNSARNIQSDDPRIQAIIKKVQEVVLRKELIAENQLNSEQMQKALEELAELEKQRQREEEVIKYQIAVAQQIQEVQTLYSEFKENAEEYKTKYIPLKEMIKVNAKGEEYHHEEGINENILTHEEIVERRQKFAGLKEKETKIAEIATQALEEKAKLHKEVKDLEQQLKEQNLSSGKIEELKDKLTVSNEKLASNTTLVDTILAKQKEIKDDMEEIVSTHKEDRAKIDRLGKIIEKTKINLEPDKHTLLTKKHALLKEQHEAIVDNKKIDEKNKGERKEIRSKVGAVNIAKNMRNNLANKEEQKKDNKTKKKGRER